MASLFKYLADIITAAAKSEVGLFALMIIVLGFLGYFFFRRASEWTRIFIYLTLVIGVGLFGWAMKKEFSRNGPPPIPTPEPPAARTFELEAGSEDVFFAKTGNSPDSFSLKLTESGQVIGSIDFLFFPGNNLFKIAKFVDGRGKAVTEYKNETRGGDKNALQDWDTLVFRLGGRSYGLRLGWHEGGNDLVSYFWRFGGP